MRHWALLLVAALAVSGCEFSTTVLGDFNNPHDPTALPPFMVTVPAGSFQRDAIPTNVSTVSSFKMSACEISRAQFASVMGITVADAGDYSYTSQAMDPAGKVSWYDAIAFCNKLSIKEGLTPVYAVSGVDFSTLTYGNIPTSGSTAWGGVTATLSNSGYRLPTEMEWMWAAMGATSDRSNGYTGVGTDTTGYTKGYAGSTESASAQASIASFAWTLENSGRRTHRVASRQANELGLYDMSGNITEHCWDWYGAYPSGPLTDYQGPATGTDRVSRGGSREASSNAASVDARNSQSIPGRYGEVGFRVVLP